MNKYKHNKGFSLVGLMAVVAIVGIFAIIAMPLYNQYIERTKVSKEIPVIGTYKQAIVGCFLKEDSLVNCNSGQAGIPEGISNFDNIISLEVDEGEITVVIDAENHVVDVSPIELVFSPEDDLSPTSPTFDWNLYCNDYTPDGNALVKECQGLVSGGSGDRENNDADSDNDSLPDGTEDDEDLGNGGNGTGEWVALEPIYSDWVTESEKTYTGSWTPAIINQREDFNQTRDYTQNRTRTETVQEENSVTGETRIVSENTESETVSGVETRLVNVDISNWSNSGSVSGCSGWSPVVSNQTSDFTQTRTCQQPQEREITYSIEGVTVKTTVENQNVSVNESRNVDVSGNVGGGSGSWSSWTITDSSCTSWSPNASQVQSGQRYLQERTCTDYRERNRYYVIDGQVVKTIKDTDTNTRTESRVQTGTYVAPATCRYNTSIINRANLVRYENGTYEYAWEGIPRFTGGYSTSSSPIYRNGYDYWVGNLVRSNSGFGGSYRLYEICRRDVDAAPIDPPPLQGVYN